MRRLIPSIWILFAMVAGCMGEVATPAATVPAGDVPTAPATPTPVPIPPTLTATLLPSSVAATPIPPSPAATVDQPVRSATPSPEAQPLTAPGAPEDVALTPPVLVDSRAGRLYAAGDVGGEPKTVVLSADSGQLRDAFDIAGSLALDPERGRLYVNQPDTGLTVLDAATGAVVTTVPLPPPTVDFGDRTPAPLADPATGHVLAFRDHTVHVINPQASAVARTIPFDIEKADTCRTGVDELPINRAFYDAQGRVLYLDFVTYVCTPWIGHTIVAYDMETDAEIARQAVLPYRAAPADGRLYGAGWHRFGIGTYWLWRDGQPGVATTDWSGGYVHLAVDPEQRRVYVPVGDRLRVLDAETLTLHMTVPLPVAGELAGYDPATQQLYFLADGQLKLYPVGDIVPPPPQPLAAAQPPAQPVVSLAVSPAWPEDRTLFGVWGSAQPAGDCYVFDQFGGQFLLSPDGGQTWQQPQAGFPTGCAYVSALAVSPSYAEDQTAFVGIAGMGIFKTTDGGRLWQPSSTGLLSMGVRRILLSPDFAADGTAFAQVRTGNLHRSRDGGATWTELGRDLAPLALAPGFGTTQTLIGAARDEAGDRRQIMISRDAGDSWSHVSDLPAGVSAALLSVAPLFERWGVVFAYGSDGVLYRSADGGATWDAVLSAGPALNRAQLVYADDIEVNRPVFLLAKPGPEAGVPPGARGQLYRSGDGGQTWQAMGLPGDADPTALALSPTFAVDGLLFVGTADGRVLEVSGR